jgi:preprotein translocase subunit SecB
MSSPIQLLDYVVERFHFQVHPAFRIFGDGTPPESAYDLQLDVQWDDPRPLSDAPAYEDLGPEAETQEVVPLDLIVHVNNEGDNEEHMYRIELALAGMFQRVAPAAMDDGPPEDYLVHTIATGISMLYGAARNVIASMTSQSPYEKLMLPAVPPFGIAKQLVEQRRAERSQGDETAPSGG